VSSIFSKNVYPLDSSFAKLHHGLRRQGQPVFQVHGIDPRDRIGIEEYVCGLILHPRLLIRSLGGWSQVKSLQSAGDRVCADERILGTGEFVERVIQEADQRVKRQIPARRMLEAARKYIAKTCAEDGVPLTHLQSGARQPAVSRCRSKIARHLVEEMGLSLAEAARQLGVCTSAIRHAIRRTAWNVKVNELKDVPFNTFPLLPNGKGGKSS